MQINPLLSTLPQMPQQVQQNQQPSVSAQQTPVPTQTNAAVSAIGKSETSSGPQDNASQPPLDQKTVDGAVKQLNEAAKMFNTQVQFAVDPATGSHVVQVVDKTNNEVISQIPSEQALRISQALGDFKGLLVKDTA